LLRISAQAVCRGKRTGRKKGSRPCDRNYTQSSVWTLPEVRSEFASFTKVREKCGLNQATKG